MPALLDGRVARIISARAITSTDRHFRSSALAFIYSSLHAPPFICLDFTLAMTMSAASE